MPWLKLSDTAADCQQALAVAEDENCDDRLVNEAFGFVLRCAVKSAQQELDYFVPRGTAVFYAGSHERFKELEQVAIRAGYWTKAEADGPDGAPRKGYRLTEDTDLFHMILRSERAWENQRSRDNRNTTLTSKVRHRDGDACRYCGDIVDFTNRRSGRGGTYDHLNPGMPAKSAEDLVVCCFTCNSARKDAHGGKTSFDKKLRPAPKEPYYSAKTAEWLTRHGLTVTPTEKRPGNVRNAAPEPQERAGQDTATAAGTETATAAPHQEERDTATDHQRDTAAQPATAPHPEKRDQTTDPILEHLTRTAATLRQTLNATRRSPLDDEQEEWAPEESICQIPADRQGGESRFVGTGRDGSGPGRAGQGQDGPGTGRERAGQGQDGSAPGEGASSGRRRRRRRGRRGRGRGGEQGVC